MKIGIISTHSFPIGLHGPVTHTGDVVIMDLVRSLSEMGHEVSFFTPENGYCPPGVTIYPMRASFGAYPPSSIQCEQECFTNYGNVLRNQDIIHDFSVTKQITEALYHEGNRNIIQTLMGGAWTHEYQPHNLITWSKSHQDRVIRGATDFENTPTPSMAGHTGKPIKDARIVNGGIDTDFYIPTYDKKNYSLWMGRWHNARGHKMAIDIARETGIELVMSGEHPDNELFEGQKQSALEAVELAKDLPNVHFEFLPKGDEHHTAKVKLYQGAKAFLYCVQFHEPFGLMQAQALACGTPVIGTNYGSVPEVITDGLTGYVCENNIQSFAEAITKIDNIEPKVCRQQAVERFDRKVMATNYMIEYQKIIRGESW